MQVLGNALLGVAAVALIAFPFCYQLTTRGHWRDTVMGWHLMSFMGALAVVMTFAILNLVTDLPSWVRPLAWLLVGGVAWWRLILLFIVQQRDGSDQRDATP